MGADAGKAPVSATCDNGAMEPNSVRYARQIALPQFGRAAQSSLASARVLVIGAGGLGSTVIPALVAAGVGTVTIVDDDYVELSNLHRQHVHSMADIGRNKAESASARALAVSPDSTVDPVVSRLSSANALDLFATHDLVIDGSDNFVTRYLVADAAELSRIPVVWGAVAQFGGQLSVATPTGPGYRDLFPTPPPPDSVLSCEAGGVFPSTVAVIGSLMAGEALKLLSGVGETLVGRVTTYDALTGGFREVKFSRDPERTAVTELVDYEALCGVASQTTDVTPAELCVQHPLVIDVREAWEAEIAALPGSRLIPLGSLEAVAPTLNPHADTVLVCHHGMRSAQALGLLQSLGFSRVRHLVGGLDAWAREIDPTMSRY